MFGELPTEILELVLMHHQGALLEWTLVSPRFNEIISRRFLKQLKIIWTDDSAEEIYESSIRSFDKIKFQNVTGVSPVMDRFMKKNVHLHKNIDFVNCQFNQIELFDLMTVTAERLEVVSHENVVVTGEHLTQYVECSQLRQRRVEIGKNFLKCVTLYSTWGRGPCWCCQ